MYVLTVNTGRVIVC